MAIAPRIATAEIAVKPAFIDIGGVNHPVCRKGAPCGNERSWRATPAERHAALADLWLACQAGAGGPDHAWHRVVRIRAIAAQANLLRSQPRANQLVRGERLVVRGTTQWPDWAFYRVAYRASGNHVVLSPARLAAGGQFS